MSDNIEVDPEEVRRHSEMAHRKMGSLNGTEEIAAWLASRKWLEERGLLAVKPERRKPGPAPPQGLPRNAYEQRAYAGANMAGSPTVPHGKLLSVRMSEVKARQIDWLWPSRFPLGMLSLIAGEGDHGKSLITIGMASAVTNGSPWPDEPLLRDEPGSVLIFCCEDRLEQTVKPRLDAAGADSARVHVATSLRRPDGHLSHFSFRRDIPALEDLLNEIADVRLLIIDPVTAYLDGSDENKNAEVRDAIRPIDELAERFNLAAVMVAHFNKGTGAKASSRVGGSGAFINVPRMCWYVHGHPEDPERKVMVNAKRNIAKRPTGLSYRTVGQGLSAVVEWDPEPVPWTAQDLAKLESERDGKGLRDGRRGPPGRKIRGAMALIMARLDGRESRHKALRKEVTAEGFTDGTFFDAMRRLKAAGQVLDFDDDEGERCHRKGPEILPVAVNGDARP